MKSSLETENNFKLFKIELLPMNNNSKSYGNLLEKYKFTGQERDYSTGLDYMHFRFYSSSMGRFLKPDNIIAGVSNPQSWNLYTYVRGNPVNFNDPFGHYGNAGMTSQLLFGPGGALGLAAAYGGMWENPQEKGTMAGGAGGYGGTAEASGTETVQGYWQPVYGQIATTANSDAVWDPQLSAWVGADMVVSREIVGWRFYGAITLPVGDSSSSCLWSVYGKTFGLINRVMSTAVFIGPQLGKLLFTRDWYFGKYGTIIVENKWYMDKLGAYAVTYGNLIVLDPDVYQSGKKPDNLIRLFNEEYGHETQEGRYGPLFYLLYAVDYLFEGYSNYFERQAQDPNAKMPW